MLLNQFKPSVRQADASFRQIVARRSAASLCLRRKRARGRENTYLLLSRSLSFPREGWNAAFSTLVRQRARSTHEPRTWSVNSFLRTQIQRRHDGTNRAAVCVVCTKPVASYAAFIFCAAFESSRAAERRRGWTSRRRLDRPIGSPTAPRRAHWPVWIAERCRRCTAVCTREIVHD